mmetsp:Transcript_17159/g.19135  ORF Transcript_17159/g.19135 Transcript_17159/m.19135 type:complete len:443 (-) Transcript_17159:55-1383(-)
MEPQAPLLLCSRDIKKSRAVVHNIVPLVNKSMFGTDSERHDDKSMRKHWVPMYFDKHGSVISNDIWVPKQSVVARVIEWPTKTGTLRGRLYAPKDTKNFTGVLAIVFSGSHGSAEENVRSIGLTYTFRGCMCLALDYIGFGASTSSMYKPYKKNGKNKWGMTGIKKLHGTTLYHDALEMWNCATTIIGDFKGVTFRPENIILHGFSLGGPIASYVASKVAREGKQVRGLVLDRIILSTKQGAVGHGYRPWQASFAAYSQGSLRASASLDDLYRFYPYVPILIISAGSDDPVQSSSTQAAMELKLIGFKYARLDVITSAGHHDHGLVLTRAKSSFLKMINNDRVDFGNLRKKRRRQSKRRSSRRRSDRRSRLHVKQKRRRSAPHRPPIIDQPKKEILLSENEQVHMSSIHAPKSIRNLAHKALKRVTIVEETEDNMRLRSQTQ